MPLHKTQGLEVKFLRGFWKGKCREGMTLNLVMIRIFQTFTPCECVRLASEESQKKYTIKVNTTLALDRCWTPSPTLSYPSNLHTGPHLWQISGGIQTPGPPSLDPPWIRPLADVFSIRLRISPNRDKLSQWG